LRAFSPSSSRTGTTSNNCLTRKVCKDLIIFSCLESYDGESATESVAIANEIVNGSENENASDGNDEKNGAKSDEENVSDVEGNAIASANDDETDEENESVDVRETANGAEAESDE